MRHLMREALDRQERQASFRWEIGRPRKTAGVGALT